jgi:hypothetical protein
MRRVALAAAAILTACAAATPLALTGELRKGSHDPRGSVRDCMTGEVFELGAMASSDYFELFQRAEKLAAERDGARDAQVIVQLEGEVSDGSPRVLAVRRVVSLRRGSCDDPVPGE